MVSDLELRRGGASYTVETLRQLQGLYPQAEWYLIIGSDMLESFHTWSRYTEILELCRLCAASRGGELRANPAFTAEQAERVTVLELEPLAMSSTEIRRRIAAGLDISAFVTPEAAHYIRKRGLYLGRPGGADPIDS